jgi:hypothetical protein
MVSAPKEGERGVAVARGPAGNMSAIVDGVSGRLIRPGECADGADVSIAPHIGDLCADTE